MNTFEDILDQIKTYDTIIIHRHQRPDPDAVGSQCGLRELLRHNFPDKRILATGINEPTLAWMTEMDEVADVDSFSSLVIVTDTANTARIDDDRYGKANCLIKIDHHPNEDVYGDLLYVDTTASSASEIITDFALKTGLELSNSAARLLYTGMVGDTGRFLYPATTSKTMSIASTLRSYNFNFSAISRQMDSFPFKIAKLQGYIFDNLEVDENGAARVVLTQETMRAFDVTEAETSAIVGTPGKIDCVQSWAIFVQQTDGQSYRVRLRSKNVVINEIAKRHDGGGHPLASGANSYSLAENEQIYQEIKDLLKK